MRWGYGRLAINKTSLSGKPVNREYGYQSHQEMVHQEVA